MNERDERLAREHERLEADHVRALDMDVRHTPAPSAAGHPEVVGFETYGHRPGGGYCQRAVSASGQAS